MNPLQIVHLESNDAEADLVHSELQHGGIACEVRRVRNESELIHELARRPVDVILADRYCPENDGLRAIAIGRAQTPEVPVILVTNANKLVNTGVQKFGALVGDNCRIGADPVIAPGAVMLPRTIVGRLALFDQEKKEM